VTHIDANTGSRLPNRATYVHVRVNSNCQLNDCTGWITLIEELGEANVVRNRLDETRPLLWAPREFRQTKVAIPPPRDLDVFMTIENENRLRLLSVGHPLTWDDFVDHPGTYRITIHVVADGRACDIKLLVTWRGRSDDFQVARS
jgi:hypothetical protein